MGNHFLSRTQYEMTKPISLVGHLALLVVLFAAIFDNVKVNASPSSSRVKRSLESNHDFGYFEEFPWRSYIPQWPSQRLKRFRPIGASASSFNTRGSSGGVIPMARIGKRFWGQNDENEKEELEKEVMIPTARIGRGGTRTMIPMARIGRSSGYSSDNHYQIPMPRIG